MNPVTDLAHEDLKSFALGVSEVQALDGGWRAHRMPAPLRPLYQRTEGANVRLQCTAGVRIRFRTDSTRMTLAVRYGAAARQQFRFALRVDEGTPVGVGPAEAVPEWQGEVWRNGDGNAHILDCWLPHLVQADILGVELDRDCRVEVVPAPGRTWIALGDSITQGMTTRLPTDSVLGRCGLALDANILNLGVGGATLDPELPERASNLHADVFSVAFGINDVNQGIAVEAYAENARHLIGALRRGNPSAPIVMIGATPWVQPPKPQAPAMLDRFREALREVVAQAAGVSYVHGPDMIPADASCFVDGVHPNEHGFAHYARNLLPLIGTALRETAG